MGQPDKFLPNARHEGHIYNSIMHLQPLQLKKRRKEEDKTRQKMEKKCQRKYVVRRGTKSLD